MKMLVIDDNQGDRKLIKAYLEEIDSCEVLEASTGEAGLEMAETERPDMIIVDMNLTGIDGHETCRRIKEADHLRAKVVVMTGNENPALAEEALQKGADAYYVKTPDCQALLEIIENL